MLIATDCLALPMRKVSTKLTLRHLHVLLQAHRLKNTIVGIALLCSGLIFPGCNKPKEDARIATSNPAIVQAETEATGEAPEAIATVPMESIADHWGIIDSNGKLVVPCCFIELRWTGWGNDPIPARRTSAMSGGWGYINRSGEQQIPEQFNEVTFFIRGIAAVQNRDKKWGLINPSGEWVIPASYDEAWPFSTNGLAAVRKGDKWGFISKAGNEVVSCSYDEHRPFSTNGLAAVRKGDRWGFISEAGNEVVSCSYTEVRDFDGNRASVSKGTIKGRFAEGGWGVIDEKGNEVVECKYFNISEFYSDHAIVTNKENKENVFDLLKIGSTGIIDRNGTFTFPLQREMVLEPVFSWKAVHGGVNVQTSPPFQLFQSFVGNGRSENRIFTPTGRLFTDIRCRLTTFSLSESLLAVEIPMDLNQSARTGVIDDSWGKVGYLDAEGKLCIPFQFESTEPFSEGLAEVSKDGAGIEKWGFIDKSGKMVIEPQFTETEPFSEGIAAVKQDDLWGYIDKNGEWIARPRFAKATSFSGGIAAVKQDELWGYIDKSGKWIAQPRFAEATPFRGGMALVKAPETGLANP